MSSRKNLIGVVASALDGDPRAAARKAREAGFDGLSFGAFGPSVDLTKLSATGRREFRHILSGQNQELISIDLQLDPSGFAPDADIDRMLARITAAIEAAAELRAPLLTLDLARLPRVPTPPKATKQITSELAGLIIIPEAKAPEAPVPPVPPPDPRFLSQAAAALDIAGRAADRFGVLVAMRSGLSSVASLLGAIKSVSCPWFGVDLDSVALLADAWTLDESFSRIGNLVRHLRARDAVLGDDGRSIPATIGRGKVDWTGLLSSLQESDFRGPITIDPTGLPNLERSASLGLSVLKGLQR